MAGPLASKMHPRPDHGDENYKRIGPSSIKQGVFSGYKGWIDRAARDRSLGYGQVDFKAVFSKLAAKGKTPSIDKTALRTN